jgi:hypothetical protein
MVGSGNYEFQDAALLQSVAEDFYLGESALRGPCGGPHGETVAVFHQAVGHNVNSFYAVNSSGTKPSVPAYVHNGVHQTGKCTMTH